MTINVCMLLLMPEISQYTCPHKISWPIQSSIQNTVKNLRWSFLRKQLTASTVNYFHKVTFSMFVYMRLLFIDSGGIIKSEFLYAS